MTDRSARYLACAHRRSLGKAGARAPAAGAEDIYARGGERARVGRGDTQRVKASMCGFLAPKCAVLLAYAHICGDILGL
jgi:hypothetical protein